MNFRNLLFAGCALAMCAAAATAQVPSYVPTNGLVGWWPFNGNANDESGNGNNGVVNGATLAADRFSNENNAYETSSGYISALGEGITTTDTISISTWFNCNSDFGIGEIICLGSSSSTSWGCVGGNHLFALNYGRGCGSTGSGAVDISFEYGTWHNVVYVSSGLNSTTSIYFDGVMVGASLNANSNNNCSNSGLFFGADIFSGIEYYDGKLDDIAIYNRALTPQEIQDLYIGCAVLPTTIAGELEPVTLSASSYACNNNAGSTYAWSVTNGVISSGQGTANVSVLWGEEGAGTLTVVETNSEGCSGTAFTIDVNVVCAISITAINGPLGPNELTATTYSCDGAGTSTYQWTITNGVISAGQGTSTVTVLWASTGLGSLSVQETTQANCTSDVISIDVVVIPTSISEETEAVLAVYPNPVQNEINIRSTLQAIGSNYTLLDGAGKLVSNGNINSTLTTIHASTLAAGTYVLRVGETFEQTIQVVR